MSVRDWFIAPPREPDEDITSWAPPSKAAPRPAIPPHVAEQAASATSARDERAAAVTRAAATPAGAVRAAAMTPAAVTSAHTQRAVAATPTDATPAFAAHAAAATPVGTSAGDARAAAMTPSVAASALAERRFASAAILGPPGEAEPLAAAIALALRARAHAAAAAVIVVTDLEPPATSGGGVRAARRLAARLSAHGFEAFARGRLAWAYVPPAAAERAVAMTPGPAALAVTVPLTAALETTVADQELAVVVAHDRDGPLAQLAVASLTGPGLAVTVSPPLPRGIPRLLARAGLRAPAEARRLV